MGFMLFIWFMLFMLYKMNHKLNQFKPFPIKELIFDDGDFFFH
jgi:hypothetical protein